MGLLRSHLGAAPQVLCQVALIPSFVTYTILFSSWAAQNMGQGGHGTKATFMKEHISAIKVTSKSHTANCLEKGVNKRKTDLENLFPSSNPARLKGYMLSTGGLKFGRELYICLL